MIVNLCRMSKSAVWESYHWFEERENAPASAEIIPKPSRPSKALFSPKKRKYNDLDR
jgi:hypothetical protein